MRCEFCGCEVGKFRQIHSNGAKVVIQRCLKCKRTPRHNQFLPRDSVPNWESLPLAEDYSRNSEPCCVEGCTEVGTELHHFAPRHLFKNADEWPTGYLCKTHHREWHEKTRTGSFTTRMLK